MRAHLVQIDAQDNAGAPLAVRLASVDDRQLCHLNGTAWIPAIETLPTLAYDFFGGDFSGRITTPTGRFTCAVSGLPALSSARFAGSRVRIWEGELGAAYATYVLRFDGKIIAEPSVQSGIAGFEIRPNDAWLDKPLLSLFAGTGGVEGPDELKGTVKPLILGNVRFAPGVLIDAVNLIYCVSGHGAVNAVNAVYDRVVSLGASTGNHANLAALLAAAIPAGSWATCNALGLVRLGAPADGQVSFDVSGDNVAGYVRKAGGIIGRIAGLVGGTVDSSNLSALDTARPWNLSLVLVAQTTAREVIQQLADSICAVAGISHLGTLFVQSLGYASPTLTLDALGASLPPVEAVTSEAVATPYWRLATQAEMSWVVHDPASVGTGYNYRGAYDAARVYRLDDMVDMPDGSVWAYISSTAGAGNTPPTWPTLANSYWSNKGPRTSGVTTGGALPSVASSVVGDLHIADDGTIYRRVNDGGILLDGFAVTLGGFRPQLAWTPEPSQPIADALAQADDAYNAANDALDNLADLANDGVLSVNEKITKLVPDSARLEDKWTALSAIASSLSVSTTAASAARTAWLVYLGGLSPAWNDTTADTAVTRSNYNAARDGYDNALYDLDRAIKAKAATVSTWAGTTGAGKAADNATVGAPAGTPVGSITASDVSSTINSGGGVANNQVATSAIQPAGVNGVAFAYTAGLATFPATTWTTIQSVALTAVGGSGMVVLLKAAVAYHASSTAYVYASFRITRDGTDITGPMPIQPVASDFSGSTNYYTNFLGTLCFSDVPGAGAHTYAFQISSSVASTGDATAEARYLEAIEVKK